MSKEKCLRWTDSKKLKGHITQGTWSLADLKSKRLASYAVSFQKHLQLSSKREREIHESEMVLFYSGNPERYVECITWHDLHFHCYILTAFSAKYRRNSVFNKHLWSTKNSNSVLLAVLFLVFASIWIEHFWQWSICKKG